MLTDAEQVNELGMPLVRGPFATLVAAREAAEIARGGPAPTSDLAARMAALPPRPPREVATVALGVNETPAGQPAPEPEPSEPPVPPMLIREWQDADGPALRRLWDLLDLRSLGDDDAGLAVMARRNPGLLLVATVGDAIVGSALGGWDGRRGWIYHVGVHPDHQRRGTARRLVAAIEDGLAGPRLPEGQRDRPRRQPGGGRVLARARLRDPSRAPVRPGAVTGQPSSADARPARWPPKAMVQITTG